jgi:hypothetical protein
MVFPASHDECHGIAFAAGAGEVPMRRLLIPALLLAASTAGCLTLMPVSSHVERGVDFGRFRTYVWGPADALPISDERLRENPFFVDDVHGAIDTELQTRGLVRATSERAELLVHYHAAVTGRLEVESRPGRSRDCVGADCRPTVNEYDAGTLVIDILDASTQQLVWRGWAEHRLEDMLDDPEMVKRRVRTAVRRIFETFPLTIGEMPRPQALEVPAFRTFAWERLDTGVPGDPRLDNNTVFHRYLQGAIERQLVSRGYEATVRQPDVYVHYHASARQKLYVSGEDGTTPRCRDCQVQVYDENTLLIDVTDARTGALLWRGVAESGLAAAVDDQTRMERAIERVVERILSKLPLAERRQEVGS